MWHQVDISQNSIEPVFICGTAIQNLTWLQIYDLKLAKANLFSFLRQRITIFMGFHWIFSKQLQEIGILRNLKKKSVINCSSLSSTHTHTHTHTHTYTLSQVYFIL